MGAMSAVTAMHKQVAEQHKTDQPERQHRARRNFEYKDCSECRINIKGRDAEIIITPSTFRIVQAGVSPRQLIHSFFEAQKQLVSAHEIKALSFDE